MSRLVIEHHADIVVVGGGPAGIAAAVHAAESGRTTLLVDQGVEPGGQIWRRGVGHEADRRAARWLARLRESGAVALARTAIIDMETARSVSGSRAPLALVGEHDGSTVDITASDAVILAGGARELFLPFPGWTLPGVVGVGGGQALLKAGWEVRGRKAVVVGSGPLLLPVAAALARAGARLQVVAEQADARAVRQFVLALRSSPARILDAVRYRMAFARTPYRFGTWPLEASGDRTIQSVTLTDGRSVESIECDILCAGFGLVPALELPLLAGCRAVDGAVEVDEFQRTSVDGVYCAGESTGIAGVDAALVQGAIAGLAAAGRDEDARKLLPRRARYAALARQMHTAFALRDAIRDLARDDTIVCRCEDVDWGRIRASGSLREAKLLTRAGMGSCQGRVCAPALQYLRGWSGDSVRPPLSPTLVSTMTHNRQPGEKC
jgi:NADPH-dependent 2,4-dienoyl-CoA reductase/sulfur reductase-like enzyme